MHAVLQQINYKQGTRYSKKARQFNMDNSVLVDRRNLHLEERNNQSLRYKQPGSYNLTSTMWSRAY